MPYMKTAIDHGTTNSALAIMEDEGPRIVQPDPVHKVMPSVVFFNRYGAMSVGHPAYQAMLSVGQGQGSGHGRYKMRIGQDDRYEFPEAKKVLTGPELGSKVIGELLLRAQTETNTPVNACVITIPAVFADSNRDGTKEAARLAGIRHCVLLQEPLAASMAYAFTANADGAQWIIFDLGGGTLDVSLVIARRGKLSVPVEGNLGEPLGGGKWDRDLMGFVLDELKSKYSLNGFKENNPAYRSAWGRLLFATEQAKIKLSDRNEASVVIDGALCKDEKGKDVRVDVPITRDRYDQMIGPDVEKCVSTCQNLLKVNRLVPKDINGIILVGGPSKTPKVRELLANRLGIPLIMDVDPMTAVALGGAIYANTVEVPDGPPRPRPDSDIHVTLTFDRQSILQKSIVSGKIESTSRKLDELSVRMERTDGQWRSKQVPVDNEGIFQVELSLIMSEHPAPSKFNTFVLDSSGRVLITLQEPEIWYPDIRVVPQVPSTLGVQVVGNRVVPLIRRGTKLIPQSAKGRGEFATTKLVRKDSKTDILQIIVLESPLNHFGKEDMHADSNMVVAKLTVGAGDMNLTSDLPIGSKLDIEIQMDQSHNMKILAYIHLTGQTFEGDYVRAPIGMTLQQISERFASEEDRLKQIKELQSISPMQSVAENLSEIEKVQAVQGIRKHLERAEQSEGGALLQAHTEVLKLASSVNQIWDEQIEVRMRRKLQRMKQAAKDKDVQAVAELERALDEAMRVPENRTRLEDLEKEIDDLDSRIRKYPYFDLLLSLMALSGRRVSLEQHRLFDEASRQIDELIAHGAPATLNNEDIRRLEEANRRLFSAHSDLPRLRDEAIKDLPDQSPFGLDRSIIKEVTH